MRALCQQRGLFATVAGFFVFMLILTQSTSNFTAWYGESSLVIVILVSALSLWAFRTSLGGQKLFTGAALEK